jgi:hypothetical protein
VIIGLNRSPIWGVPGEKRDPEVPFLGYFEAENFIFPEKRINIVVYGTKV